MFACPHCLEALRRQATPQGFAWVCPRCQGRAVGIGVLRRLVKPEYVQAVWSASERRRGGPGRACPICHHPMWEAPIDLSGVTQRIDVCRRCQFFWFDPSEFEAAPPKPPPSKPAVPSDPTQLLPPSVRQQLALQKVKQMARDTRAARPDDWHLLPALLGLPIEVDAPPLQQRPVFTWVLAGAILMVSLMAFATGLSQVVNEYGFLPSDPFRRGGLTLLTSFFVHGGVVHLVSNLWFLVVFGDNAEDVLGGPKFLLMIGLGALAGSLTHWLGDPRGDVPCIGASGGISAAIAWYTLAYPKARLGLMWRFYWRFRWCVIPVTVAFGLWIALQLLGAALQVEGLSDVSSLAHLGGVLVGVLFWLRWRPSRQP